MVAAMSQPRHPRADVAALLAVAEGSSPVEAIDVMVDELADMIGATRVYFLITDLSGRALARFGGSNANAARERVEGADHASLIPLPGTLYERVLRTQQPDVTVNATGVRLMVPVTDRGDAVGILELELPWVPDATDIADLVSVGRALAYVVVACRRHTDLFEWAQRSKPFSLAAEIQRRLLPSAFTCEAGRFTVSGWLEPADAVGGDTFDYALDRDRLHVSITDAVGHEVHAALLATVLVGSLRNSRRSDMDLAAQASVANDALARHSAVGDFVTGQLVRVVLATAELSIVNAGHPFPFRVRDGRAEQLELAIDMPFGIAPGREFRIQRIGLEPGDRIVLLTDGMLERNAEDLDVAEVLERTADLHPREVVYVLGEAVLEATGAELHDDATVVCLDWNGGPVQGMEDPGTTAAQVA